MPTGIYVRTPQPEKDPLPRFWKRVDKTATCWLWIGPVRGGGYGQFWYRGRSVPASRFIYEHLHGPLAADQVVCHRCDTPACVRDEHLFAGSVLDNVRDSITKGRWMTERRLAANASRVNYGVDVGTAKLTEAQVREIRAAYIPRRVGSRWDVNVGPSLTELANRYGVTKGAIMGIVKNKTWTHLP